MANKRRIQEREKELGLWERGRLWMGRNEKVIMVALLIMIAPLFAFTGPVYDFFAQSAATATVTEVYGVPVTRGEVERTGRLLTAVQTLDPQAFSVASYFLGRQAQDGDSGYSLEEFFAYRATAERLALAVSDRELQERIRDAWRYQSARDFAVTQLDATPPTTQQESFQRQISFFQDVEKRRAELKDMDAFDLQEWRTMVKNQRVRLGDLEETLRDVYLLGKLQEYVLANVQVTPEEVFEKYRLEDQERKFSWVEATPSDALKAAFASSLTAESIERYYRDNRDSFRKDFSLKTEYLLIPLEHFKEVVKQKATEEDYRKTYERNRNSYRRPVISTDESAFALRTADEQEALEAELFLPFEDVQEEVRETHLVDEGTRELLTFANTLRDTLQNPTGTKTPADLAKEHPFLKLGATDFVTQDEAEETLGDAYAPSTIDGWYRRGQSDRGGRVRIDPPGHAVSLPDDLGRVFYTSVETRAARVPRLRAIEPEVRERYALEQATRALKRALDASAEALADGDLASVVSTPIQVAGPTGEDFPVTLGAVMAASSYAKRYSRGGALKFSSEPDEEASSDEGDDSAPEETRHEDSQEILVSGFSVEEKGQTKAAVDGDWNAAYLVRLEDIKYPDPADFESRRASLESQLERERQADYFTTWRASCLRESFGRPLGPDGGEASQAGEEVAQN